MKKIYFLILVGTVTLVVGAAVVQESTTAALKVQKVAGTVSIIFADDATPETFTGGNVAVSIGQDGVVMVDSKMPPASDGIATAISELGGKSPKYILNTHSHGDHTRGNARFQEHGTVLAHTNVRARLAADRPAEEWPVITFDNSLSIFMNGEEVKAVHYPRSHTDGDAVVYFTASNVIHMGDLYFNGLLPFVDLDSGGSVQGYLKHVKQVLAEAPDDVQIIPGHGPLATKKDLQQYARMLEETTTLVTAKMKQGKSLAEIQQEGLQEEWQSWAWYFISVEKWIATIHSSYLKDLD